MEHHTPTLPFARSALCRICAIACVDAARLNLTPLVATMIEWRDTIVERTNALATHERACTLDLFMAAAPDDFERIAPAPENTKPRLCKKAFERWFRHRAHNPDADCFDPARVASWSKPAFAAFQHHFEHNLARAIRRRGDPADAPAQRFASRLIAYAKYLHRAQHTITADEVQRLVAAIGVAAIVAAAPFAAAPDIAPIAPEPAALPLIAAAAAQPVAALRRIALSAENNKAVNDRAQWRKRPMKVPAVKVQELSKSTMMMLVSAYVNHQNLGVVRKFDPTRSGIYTLFGNFSMCLDWVNPAYATKCIEKQNGMVWTLMQSVPIAQMTAQQRKGLLIGLMSRDELLAGLGNIRLNDSRRWTLGIDAGQVMAHATTSRLRLFGMLEGKVPMAAADPEVIARRTALIGRDTVVCNGFACVQPFEHATYTSQPDADPAFTLYDADNNEIVAGAAVADVTVVCGKGGRALLAAAIINAPVDTVVVNTAMHDYDDTGIRDIVRQHHDADFDFFSPMSAANTGLTAQEAAARTRVHRPRPHPARAPNMNMVRMLNSFGFRQARAVFAAPEGPRNFRLGDGEDAVFFVARKANIATPELIRARLDIRPPRAVAAGSGAR